MLHIVAAIKHNSDKITHLKVFDGYSMRVYDIATFVMLWAFPEYRAIEAHTDLISSEIQNNNANIRITPAGIVLEGYSDISVLNEKGKVLHPGRVIFTKAGTTPIKAIQSGFKEVQCSSRDLERKLVCNFAEYYNMLSSCEYVIKWEDCYSRFDIIFPKDLSARCLLAGIDYSKNRVGLYTCDQAEFSLLDQGILVDAEISIRLEDSKVEQLILPIAVKSANIELINCHKLRQIICPYGTNRIKITGSVGVKILRTTLLSESVAKTKLAGILEADNAADIQVIPRVIQTPQVI